jgi:hypothetical protein
LLDRRSFCVLAKSPKRIRQIVLGGERVLVMFLFQPKDDQSPLSCRQHLPLYICSL